MKGPKLQASLGSWDSHLLHKRETRDRTGGIFTHNTVHLRQKLYSKNQPTNQH